MNQPAPGARALIGVFALCLGVCLLAGCYTTLRHPMTADLPGDYSYQEKSCYDCHDEAAFYHSNYGVYFDYYNDSPWFGYYSDPWWYGTYWQGCRRRENRGPDFQDSGTRDHWQRGIPSGSPRGGSSTRAPYLRDDYKPAPAKPSQPPKKAEKPKSKESKDERTKGQRGKKK